MDKEKIIEILEDYEFFVDDDFGGHYEHINCSQKALTPLGIVVILNYISELEKQCKKQKEVIDKVVECLNLWQIPECDKGTMREILFNTNKQNVLDILNEVLE